MGHEQSLHVAATGASEGALHVAMRREFGFLPGFEAALDIMGQFAVAQAVMLGVFVPKARDLVTRDVDVPVTPAGPVVLPVVCYDSTSGRCRPYIHRVWHISRQNIIRGWLEVVRSMEGESHKERMTQPHMVAMLCELDRWLDPTVDNKMLRAVRAWACPIPPVKSVFTGMGFCDRRSAPDTPCSSVAEFADLPNAPTIDEIAEDAVEIYLIRRLVRAGDLLENTVAVPRIKATVAGTRGGYATCYKYVVTDKLLSVLTVAHPITDHDGGVDSDDDSA